MTASYVYVSNAEDGDIGMYFLEPEGALRPGPRFTAGANVMPMAVRPDKRILVASVRSQPFSAHAFAIDRATGALAPIATGPLAESLPYIVFDRSGRYLLGASYGGNLVSVNPVAEDGRVGAPIQVIPTARNAHCIRIDATNRFAFVPHLGTDQVFQFVFDERSGRLSANTPPVLQLGRGTGPRHLVFSPDNRFVFLVNELTATVTTLRFDGASGLLSEAGSASALPPDTPLVPGHPRPTPGHTITERDIWASDIHITPDGRFLYAAERASSSIGGFRVDAASGRLDYIGSTPTEKQPRGFRIDPTGRFLIASGEKSQTLSSYSIDPSSGALRLVGRYAGGKGANWVEIVSF